MTRRARPVPAAPGRSSSSDRAPACPPISLPAPGSRGHPPPWMRSGSLGPTIGTVEIDGRRRIRSTPRPIVAGINPDPAGFGTTATGVEHRDRGIVGEQLLRGKDVLGEPCLQRLQPPDGAANPVGERRTIQLDALPGEDLALPVKRQVIPGHGREDRGWPGPWRSDAPGRAPDGWSRTPGSHSAAGRCG